MRGRSPRQTTMVVDGVVRKRLFRMPLWPLCLSSAPSNTRGLAAHLLPLQPILCCLPAHENPPSSLEPAVTFDDLPVRGSVHRLGFGPGGRKRKKRKTRCGTLF